MSEFDYSAWVRRAVSFVSSLPERLPLHNVENSLHIIAPNRNSPSIDYDFAINTLPENLQRMYREGALEISCFYSVQIGEEYFYGGPTWISPDKIQGLKKQYDEFFSDILDDIDDENSKYISQNFIPFIKIPNGDLIAIDPDPKKQHIYYVAHDDDSVKISNSLIEFLTEWEKCCYIGPESWDLEKYGGLGPNKHLNGNTESAIRLRQRLGVQG
jgi:hypothetical protein